MLDPSSPTGLWRNRRYLVWLLADTTRDLASALSGFAIPLLALLATGSPTQAGILGATSLAVRLLTSLIGGVLADRHNRVRLMILGGSIGVALSAAFTACAFGGELTFSVLLALDILLAARAGLYDVAGESALKEVVPGEQMGRAQAANQGRDAAVHLAGAPLGGVLLGLGGWAVAVAMTLCHAISTVAAVALGRSAPTDAGVAPERTLPTKAWAQFREGITWLFARRDLRGAVAIATIVNLGFNATLTTIVFSLASDNVSPVVIGGISTAAGAAMLAGALIAPLLVRRVSAGVLTVIGLSSSAMGAFALTLVHEPWSIALVLALTVLPLPALNASLMGYFMVATPTELLGRANSVIGVLSLGAMPLAPLISGFGLDLIGRDATVAICAGLCAVAVAVALFEPSLRALPRESGWADHAERFTVTPAPHENEHTGQRPGDPDAVYRGATDPRSARE